MAERNWEKDWERCEKATPGPWVVYEDEIDALAIERRIGTVKEHPQLKAPTPIVTLARHCLTNRIYVAIRPEDADFIAEAREGWPAALEERARLEARVRELEVENTDLLAVAKAARKVVDYFEAQKDFMSFAAAISELDVALVKADAWLTGRQIGREAEKNA